ncbi:MAG: hypothetical protein GF392_06110 [Candidatus Omnitrophica bacterium]|nr:hypothetical protein [Candidatus Omnitrophota bacterium]
MVKALFILSVGLIFMAAGTMAHASPVAHWKFNDASGTTAFDSSGSNNGTLNGGTAWTTGPKGGALSFNGTDGFVHVLASPGIQSLENYTISFWVNIDVKKNYNPVFFKQQGNSSAIEFYVRAGNVLNPAHNRNNSGGRFDYEYLDLIPNGTWTQVAVTYDAPGQRILTYINGSVSDGASNFRAPDTDNYPVDIGRITSFSDGSSYLDGSLDDMGLWDRPLADWEIEHAMNFGVEGFDTLLNTYGYGDAEMDALYAHIGAAAGEGLTLGDETWFYDPEPLPDGREVGDSWSDGQFRYIAVGSTVKTYETAPPTAPELPMGMTQMMVLGLGGVLARFRRRA